MNLNEFLSKIMITYDNWNDYGYYQTAEIRMPETEEKFYVHIFPNSSETYANITKNVLANKEKGEQRFLFISDEKYYQTINKLLENQQDKERWFELTGDIAYMNESFVEYYNQINSKMKELEDDDIDNDAYESLLREKNMFDSSFFRGINRRGDWEDKLRQLHRLTIGKEYLSEYSFDIYDNDTKLFSVDVKPKDNIVLGEMQDKNILPYSVSNNVFAIIGDNGSGKTTFIKNLVNAFLTEEDSKIGINIREKNIDTKENANSIDKILYVSFSPFDSKIQGNEKFKYIGIHDFIDMNQDQTKDTSTILSDKFCDKIVELLQQMIERDDARRIWFQAMNRVSSEKWIRKLCFMMEDDFKKNLDEIDSKYYRNCKNIDNFRGNIKELSSGQKIFLLSLTSLTLEMTERTVVFFDEPELFLHPPLIKAYIRLIMDLISKYNGLAFIVTHSPVTIQEIPDRCVKVARRNEFGEYVVTDINSKTFGESISNINETIFHVGLVQTGYYNLIETLSATGKLECNKHKLEKIVGSEGKVLMKYLLGNSHEENRTTES